MQGALREVEPTVFDDLVALVSLCRPGVMDKIPAYARAKRDPRSVVSRDPRLDPILAPTFGMVLYQEQTMQIAQALAGFSGAKAADLRRAFGVKNRTAMAELEPAFREGCARNNVAPDTIDWLWETNAKAADHTFHKAQRRRLRADRLPDGLVEGQPHGGVHGGTDLWIANNSCRAPSFVARCHLLRRLGARCAPGTIPPQR